MIYKTLHRKLSQRRTDNTITKRKNTSNYLQNTTQKTKSKKDRQYNYQKKKEKQWSTKHYTENEVKEGQTIRWPKEKGEAMICKTLHRKLNQRRTDNTMTKRKRRSNDLQNTTQKTKSKKDRQYNDQKKKDKQWSTKHYTEN
jgi:hypothetical protein